MATNEIRYVIEKCENGSLKGHTALIQGLQDLIVGRWTIGIKKYRKQRSTLQNAFYWGNFLQSQVDCLKENLGETHSKELMHEWNKTKFWGREHVIEATGEIITLPESSTAYTTVEWEERLENIRQWFRQNFQWELPLPNEQSEINY